jgi:hypothetical protein
MSANTCRGSKEGSNEAKRRAEARILTSVAWESCENLFESVDMVSEVA